MMTNKEKEALKIIEPHIEQIKKFHRSRSLINAAGLIEVVANAYLVLTDDEVTYKKLSSGGGCSACATRAFNALYRLYEQSVSNGNGGKDNATSTNKPKRKRGRPRKQDKPTK